MKKASILMTAVFLAGICLALYTPRAFAFDSGSTGADGAFEPTSDTVLEVPPDGVFNFTTVNIPSGVTVSFKKNEANTPVYILTTGGVIIAGTLTASGLNATATFPGKGGPGGFDGGFGGVSGDINGGRGLGPGGGSPGTYASSYYAYRWRGGGGGGFMTIGSDGTNLGSGGGAGGDTYGNGRIVPLIGGSGGGGGTVGGTHGGPGGGGGGAVLIASNTTITISGTIVSNGGYGYATGYYSSTGAGGSGSGGAIKLIADTIDLNSCTLNAVGGATRGGGYNNNGGKGGSGRIRLEANTINGSAANLSPLYSYGYPTQVFDPNVPVLKIVSVGGLDVPENASGSYGDPDIVLPLAAENPVDIVLEAVNIPVGTAVTVSAARERSTPSSGSAILSGTLEKSSATVQMSLSKQGANVLVASATFDLQTASNPLPLYAEGEKVIRMRISSALGGGTEITYITESGKEYPAEKLVTKG